MRITLNQRVELEGDRFPHRWSKEYDSVIIPHKGDFIEDPLWKDPYEYMVMGVTINYDSNECYVEIDKFSDVIPDSRKDDFAKMAKLHGWTAGWAEYKIR